MEETVNSIDTILNSPEADPFKKPPTNIKALYRAIVPKNNEINEIKTGGKIVAFATDIKGAHEFIHTLDIQDRYVIIKKEFRPQDFLLDYTSLYETYDETTQGMYYLSEHEVWMKNTPYYRSAQKDEVVYDSAKDVAQETKENISGKLSYQGNCTQDDIIDHIFGDVNNFARLVDEYGDEFELNDLVVKYDPEKDIHSFYYKINESASGYIPSNAEKNDPRYCMALTVDVHPDTMKKDAKKFGNKISRAGIPPTLKANGKF